ncbi:hypothetical protein [Nostoc sp. WHI]|uniref:hypothetical protein n=1 Tax=Nostoc sp. WHI TaxID=2650611 RepID=UPI0018C65FED|nr:hypothetical protein [Nostoc sp. WHI]MBG1269362.1 hypothetical protein [Nostoc sp. WHI]
MRNRKKTKVKLLLEVLSDGQWHLGDELATKVGHRFGDAVDKARDKQNQPIETDRVGVGQKHKYRLLNV